MNNQEHAEPRRPSENRPGQGEGAGDALAIRKALKEGAPERQAEKKAHTLGELRVSLPDEFPPGTPDWLRGPQNITLRDGTNMRLSDAYLRELRDVLVKADQGGLKGDQPVIAGGCLFLPNQETGETRWIRLQDIPNGYSKVNNFWLYRQGDTLQARCSYPEDLNVITDQWRRALGKPRMDSFGQETRPDPRLREVNQGLNRDIEMLLKKGTPLGDALDRVRQDRQEVLRVLLLGYSDALAIFSANGLGTPSALKTYMELKGMRKPGSGH